MHRLMFPCRCKRQGPPFQHPVSRRPQARARCHESASADQGLDLRRCQTERAVAIAHLPVFRSRGRCSRLNAVAFVVENRVGMTVDGGHASSPLPLGLAQPSRPALPWPTGCRSPRSHPQCRRAHRGTRARCACEQPHKSEHAQPASGAAARGLGLCALVVSVHAPSPDAIRNARAVGTSARSHQAAARGVGAADGVPRPVFVVGTRSARAAQPPGWRFARARASAASITARLRSSTSGSVMAEAAGRSASLASALASSRASCSRVSRARRSRRAS